MSRRISFCHICDITSPEEITGYLNGRPQYGEPITEVNIPCRFYRLKGNPTETGSGTHVIEITKIRFHQDVHLPEGAVITGRSEGYERSYHLSGLPEVVYNRKRPVCLECYLKSVDGEA